MVSTNPRYEAERRFLLFIHTSGPVTLGADQAGQAVSALKDAYIEAVIRGPFTLYKITHTGLERLEELGDM